MKKLFLILTSFFSITIQAQDLHIYYNLYKDSLWYEKNGKPTSNLTVRKGKQVFFHVVEYNNYIYQSEIETSFHAVAPPGYENESNSFLGMFPSLINSLVPGGSAVLPLLNAPIFGSILNTLQPAEGEAASRGDNEDIEEYKEKLLDIEARRNEINSLVEEINNRSKADKLLRGNMDFIQSITTNSNIAPSLIKSMLTDYFNEALMIPSNQTFVLKDINVLSDKMNEIPALKSSLLNKSNEYEIKLTEFKKLHKRLKSSDHGIEALYPLMKEYEQLEPSIHHATADIASSCTIDSTQTAPFDYQNAIQKNYLKYAVLQNNNFSIVYNSEASSRFILMELSVYLRDSNATSNLVADKNLRLYKTLKVKVNTYGGFGLVTSIGVQGVAYKSNLESYYINNDILQSQELDRYVPFVGSLFNISYQFNSVITPALSIGIGIPLSNKDVIDNLSYMVGPTIIFGKAKNLALNAGLMFSKVQRLDKNLKVGDSINIGDGTIPTSSRFEKGFFFGISYNISGN